MIRSIHIKLLLLFSLSILFGHSALGQVDQHVCQGSMENYHMYGFVDSEVDWTIVNSAGDVVGTVVTNTITNATQHTDADKSEYYKSEFSYTWTTVGTYRIRIVERNGSCSSDIVEITVQVDDLPATPSGISTQNFCGSGTVGDLPSVSESDAIDWYSAATGGIALVDATVLSTGTYYAESRNTSTTCVSSSRLSVTVTITDLPNTSDITHN